VARGWRDSVALTADVAVGDFDREPMEYEIDHVGPPRVDWYTARCLTCRATRPFRLVGETAHKAIMKHAVEQHGGFVVEGEHVLRISFTRRR
jgi:hypothetical protein